ncbi:MAG: hypothetical protein QGF59_28135 [Pirellulaceae bacterium]|jgi:hypothetical protein|nr:hypothetical protein [Pirellulaceae bacterium]
MWRIGYQHRTPPVRFVNENTITGGNIIAGAMASIWKMNTGLRRIGGIPVMRPMRGQPVSHVRSPADSWGVNPIIPEAAGDSGKEPRKRADSGDFRRLNSVLSPSS